MISEGDQSGQFLEELVLRRLAFHGLADKVDSEGLGAAGLACDEERDLIHQTSNDDEDVLLERSVLANARRDLNVV